MAGDRDHHELSRYLTRRAGLSFAGSRGAWLRSTVGRATARVAARPEEAIRVLDADNRAFARLCDEVTVQESFFFRERRALDLVREVVLEPHDRSQQLRVWSAGCASGEEAYTLAAVVTDAGLGAGTSILATDLSSAAVASATRATYGRWALRGVDEATVARWFTLTRDGWRVRDRLRSLVTVEQHNLMDPPPASGGGFHLVICRNVLIYLTPAAVRRVVGHLVAALAPGGWLLTSASDPLLADVAGLEVVQTAHGLAYRRGQPQPQPELEPVPAPSDRSRPRPPGRRAPGTMPSPRAAARRTDVAETLAAASRALDLGDPHGAELAARQALEAGSDANGHRLLVRALGEQNAVPAALAHARRAVAAFPLDAELRHLQALLLLESGEPAEAALAARQAVYLAPTSVECHLVLARCHEALGDTRRAQRGRRNAGRLLAREVAG